MTSDCPTSRYAISEIVGTVRGEKMTSMSELEELLYVERIHAGHFEEWAKRATDPTAKMIFRLAADKERNHVGWVELMIELAKYRTFSRSLGAISSR